MSTPNCDRPSASRYLTSCVRGSARDANCGFDSITRLGVSNFAPAIHRSDGRPLAPIVIAMREPSALSRGAPYSRPSCTRVSAAPLARSTRMRARSHDARDAYARYKVRPSSVHSATETRGPVMVSVTVEIARRAPEAKSISQSPARVEATAASPVGAMRMSV